MFCSQCGKELPEGAAFCPSCGSSVNGANPVQPAVHLSAVNYGSANIGISTEEKTKKLVAIAAYIPYMIMEMIFFWSIVATDGTIIYGEDHSPMISYALDKLWDEMKWFFISVALVITLFKIVCVISYIIAYTNRSFSRIMLLVDNSFGILIAPACIFASYKLEELFGYFPMGLFSLSIPVTVLAIIADITYYIAEKYERDHILKEKEAVTKSTLKNDETIKSPNGKRYASNLAKISAEVGDSREEYWICPECGTRNRLLNDQCKDCGKYR